MVKIETWTKLRKSHFCPILTFDHDISTVLNWNMVSQPVNYLFEPEIQPNLP